MTGSPTPSFLPTPERDLLGTAHLPQEARHRLFFQFRRMALKMASKYIGMTPAHKVDPEDLKMAAYEGLLYAIDHFDPARMRDEGTRNDGLRRFACRCIFGYLMMEMITQDPLSQRLIEQVRQYRRQADELAQFLGRAPTGAELRQALGCRDEKRFQLLEELANYHVNMESLAPEEGGDEDQEGIEDWNVTQRTAASAGRNALAANPPYEAAVLHLLQEQLQAAIGDLPPLEQQLIQVHYYQEETLTQISRDIGISRQTLSKHHQRALAHLNETLTERGLGEESLPEVWEVDLV